MKTRNGFVSNSSSSSYIIIIADDAFENVLSEISDAEIYRKIIRQIVRSDHALGMPCKVLGYCSGNESTWECSTLSEVLGDELAQELENYCEENGLEPWDEFYDAIGSYGNIVQKHEKGFYHSEYH